MIANTKYRLKGININYYIIRDLLKLLDNDKKITV